MKNLGQMMKQAQQMQTRMAELQTRLGEMEVEGQSGGSMVQATLTGKGELRRLRSIRRSPSPRRSRCWKTSLWRRSTTPASESTPWSRRR